MTTATTTKERPILFSAPMVRAILEGRKTQTRRIVKDAPREGEYGQYSKRGGGWLDGRFYFVAQTPESNWPNAPWSGYVEPCPFGKPGDWLWVKHPTRVTGRSANGFRVWDIGFPTEGNDRFFRWHEFEHKVPAEGKGFGRGFPRVLSRLRLEITDVRVERLQDISEADAQAEGVEPVWRDFPAEWRDRPAALAFCRLWRDINGEKSWGANPWVWALTFRRLA